MGATQEDGMQGGGGLHRMGMHVGGRLHGVGAGCVGVEGAAQGVHRVEPVNEIYW